MSIHEYSSRLTRRLSHSTVWKLPLSRHTHFQGVALQRHNHHRESNSGKSIWESKKEQGDNYDFYTRLALAIMNQQINQSTT